MTAAGQNRRATIWRWNYSPDDVVGGAMLTGTVLYTNVPLRMQQNDDQQIFLQQGLETQKTFTGILIPGTLNVRERDELIITAPCDDIYSGCYFRIVGVHYSDLNPRDPRNYLRVDLVRSERSHAKQ